MPEHTTFTVRSGRHDGFIDSLSDSEILMISRHYLVELMIALRKADKVFYDVQQPRLLKQPFVESVKLRIRCILITSVLGLPLHEAVEPRSDCPRLVGRKVADDTESVVNEHRRNVVYVVAYLIIGVFRPDFVLGRAFEFHYYKRQPVYEQNDIGTTVVSVLYESELIDDFESVVFDLCVINEFNYGGTLFPTIEILDLDAVLQISHKNGVLLHDTAALEIFELGNRFLNGFNRQTLVDLHKAIEQCPFQNRARVITRHVGRVNMGVPHPLQQFDYRLFVCILGKEHP